MLRHRVHDGVGELVDRRHLVAVAHREAAAEVDHAQVHAGVAQVGEQHAHAGDRDLVGRGAHLLAADVERQAVRVEPHLAGADHQLARRSHGGAELARQRPVRALVLDQQAAIHPAAGRMLGQLLQLLDRVEGEHVHAGGEGALDGGHLLDGVAEADRARRGARIQAHARPPRRRRRRTRCPGRPAAPGSARPGWPSRRSRCAPAAGRAGSRDSSPPRDPRRGRGTGWPDASRPGTARSWGHRTRAF